MRTVLEQLAEAYPEQIDRIKQLTKPEELASPAEATPGEALKGAFIWSETDEGFQYWFDLAARGR